MKRTRVVSATTRRASSACADEPERRPAARGRCARVRSTTAEQRPVDERRAVQRHEHVTRRARGRARRRRPSSRNAALGWRRACRSSRCRRSGSALASIPSRARFSTRLVRVDEEEVRDLVGEDAVDLLRHGAVEAAQPGLDMGDRDAELRRDERGGQRRVDVAGHEARGRARSPSDRLERSMTRAVCSRVRAGADPAGGRAAACRARRRRRPTSPVVVLAGVHEDVRARQPPPRAAMTGAIFTKFGRAPTTYKESWA